MPPFNAVTVTPSATPTLTTTGVTCATITGQTQNITSMSANLTGSPLGGDLLMWRITDNGTPVTITWGTSYENSGSQAPPTVTIAGVMVTIGWQFNAVTGKWRCLGRS